MGQRLQLHDMLLEIVPNVYFQQPASNKMVYPCIRYSRSDEKIVHANNVPYKNTKRYQVIVIDRNPDSEIPDKISKLPMCRFSRFYTADNLNHFVYELYF